MKKIGERHGFSVFESDKKCIRCLKSIIGRRIDLLTQIFCSNACHALHRTKKIPENLSELYLEKKLSINKISQIFSVSDTTVKKWLAEKNIKMRSFGQSISISQRGIIHSKAWNEKIRQGHLKRGRNHHLSGRNHHMFSKPPKNPDFKFIKAGYRDDLPVWVRSSWEANYFRILRYQKENGQIQEFFYETQTFYFDDGKAPHSYCPDFKIILSDGTEEFIEIKGKETQKDVIRFAKFSKFYPFHILKILRYREYMELERSYRKLIPTWEKVIPPSLQALKDKRKLKQSSI